MCRYGGAALGPSFKRRIRFTRFDGPREPENASSASSSGFNVISLTIALHLQDVRPARTVLVANGAPKNVVNDLPEGSWATLLHQIAHRHTHIVLHAPNREQMSPDKYSRQIRTS